MNTDKIAQLEELLERELSVKEEERLRTVERILGIGNNDVLWSIVAALEYHRTYYDELPQKITAASTDILQGISSAAEMEARRAQGALAESVAELARKLAVRINMITLLPMGFGALLCLLIYGSLAMWAGVHIGSGQAHDVFWILRMPSGLLMSIFAFAGGLYLGVHAAREYAEGGKGWRKTVLSALTMLVPGGVLFSLSI